MRSDTPLVARVYLLLEKVRFHKKWMDSLRIPLGLIIHHPMMVSGKATNLVHMGSGQYIREKSLVEFFPDSGDLFAGMKVHMDLAKSQVDWIYLFLHLINP